MEIRDDIKKLEKEEDKLLDKIWQTDMALAEIDDEIYRIGRLENEVETNFDYAWSHICEAEYYSLSESDWYRMMELKQRQQHRQYDIQNHLTERLAKQKRASREKEDELEILHRQRWKINDRIEDKKAEARRNF